MRLSRLLACLPTELTRLSSDYERERRSHESLAPYPTLSGLLEALRRPGPRAAAERRALTARVIEAYQTRPHAVWSTVLLHVFAGVLRKLRKRLVGGDDDTREGIVVEAFQETLASVPVRNPELIFLCVRRALRRRVFRRLAEVSAWEQIGFGSDADLEPDPDTVEEPLLLGVWLKGLGARPKEAELLPTLVDHGGLRALVDRRYAGQAEAARARAYRRLHKQRSRLVSQLRQQLPGGTA